MAQISLLQLLSSNLFTETTKKALKERLAVPVKSEPEFFTVHEFRLLQTVSARLLPQQDSPNLIDVAGLLDTALFSGKGNGWRYDKLPSDQECFRLGLSGIEEESLRSFNSGFESLNSDQQDDILLSIQEGRVNWRTPDPELFFEELLVTLTELYYSHPCGRMEMNDLSAADAAGWNI